MTTNPIQKGRASFGYTDIKGPTGGSYLDLLSSMVDVGTGMYGVNMQYELGKQALELERENFGFQQKQDDWAKQLQKSLMQREDNALTRKVGDAARAGLHPLAAIGATGAKAGPMVNLPAPQHGTKGLEMQAEAMKSLFDVKSVGMTIAELGAIKAQTRKTNAEASYLENTQPLREQIVSEDLQKKINENKILKETMEDAIEKVKQERSLAEIRTKVADYEKQMTDVQRAYVVEFRNHLVKYYTATDKEGNTVFTEEGWAKHPENLTYVAMELANAATKHNIDITKGTQIPVGGQTRWENQLGLIISQVLNNLERRLE